ncbi:MAG: lactate utilization protein [Desulfamplus sp.]|nr:lactate utilization protein [Desulfamplus sp.]
MNPTNIISEFKEKASLVSAVIHETNTIEDAFRIALSLCKKNFIIASPQFDNSALPLLEKLCIENGITLLKDSLRKYTNGIDMGITFADFGIAETGTIVVSSDSEDKRLSTMISEIHVALLYKSNIRSTALDMADELSALTSKPSSYTAFITGPSRTADIERVLAIGVHGPLELHIILLEDKE